MARYTADFTEAGNLQEFSIKKGDSFSYAVSGTFELYWTLQVSTGGGWTNVATSNAAATGTVKAEFDSRYRFVVHTPGVTPGTMTILVTELVESNKTLLITNAAGQGKAGTTAGWVVAAGSNIALVTCPASQSASTLVVPVNGLKVGQKITGFYATGQIESAGNIATLDVALRKHTAAAADVSDALVAGATQLSVTADTIVSASNTRRTDFNETVGGDETFYFLVTATTAAATDVALQSVTLEIEG
jgi:hypothetical protein